MTIFMNFIFISPTLISIVILALKQHRFIASCYDITTKFIKVDKLKKTKLFVQDLNIKVMKIQNFNTNFHVKIMN